MGLEDDIYHDGMLYLTRENLKRYGPGVRVIGVEVMFHDDMPFGQLQYWHKDERFHCVPGVYQLEQFTRLKALVSGKCLPPLTTEQLIEQNMRSEWRRVCFKALAKPDSLVAQKVWDEYYQPVLDKKLKAIRKPYDQETDVDSTMDCRCRECAYQRGCDDALKACADDVKDAVESWGLRFNAADRRTADVEQIRELTTQLHEQEARHETERAYWKHKYGNRDLTNEVARLEAQVECLKSDEREWSCLLEDRDMFQEMAKQQNDKNKELQEELRYQDERLHRQADTIRQVQEISKQLYLTATGNSPYAPDDEDYF